MSGVTTDDVVEALQELARRIGPMVSITPDSPKQTIAVKGMMLRVLAGSEAHGTAIAGQGDRDEMGICVEPPETVIGLQKFEQYAFRTQPEGVCSGPGDLDLTVYGLRKYAALAAQGNPTILTPLFVGDEFVLYTNDFGLQLRERRDMFLSQQAGARFKGYLHSQRLGLMGKRSGGTRNQGRADIRAKYGFDCYLDDTEFLTRRGWQRYDDIVDDEAIGTFSTETGAVEFQEPTARLAKTYTGPIHYFRHRYTSCAVTPGHQMWTSPVNRGPCGRIGNGYRPEVARWDFRPAVELERIHHVRIAGAPRETEYPISDPKLALYGCYLSEGFVVKRRNDGTASVLSMTQQVGGRMESALALAGSEFPMRTYTYTRADGERSRPCTYTIYNLPDRELATTMDVECGQGSRGKKLPSWAFDLSARQAKILLSAMMSGDGTQCRGGWQVYYSTSRQLAGDVQALAVIAGRRANMWGPYAPKGVYQVMVQEPGGQVQAVQMRSNHRVESVTNGRVVCFEVPNGTLVTRREGRVAMQGNCKFATHMVRLGVQGVELLRTGSISMPVGEPELAWLRDLRQGHHTKEEALDRAEELETEIDALMLTTDLPEHPDWESINSWLASVHVRYWGLS